MVLLYVYPFITPSSRSFAQRLDEATINWILWLTCFTEVVFQIPHNVLVSFLNTNQGSAVEWPFASYGLSDDRWNNYNNGNGLTPAVELINWNDGILGVLVLAAWVYQAWAPAPRRPNARILLAIITVFRDATLWRETVEYMWDHHRLGYPHTTTDPAYRPHAIMCLWIVNGAWLVAPILTCVWAYNIVVSGGLAAGEGKKDKND